MIKYVESGETYYRNAGRTKRTGFEAMVVGELGDGLRLTAAYTFSRARFVEYVPETGPNEDKNLVGNQVPGIPENTFYAELLYAHANGFFFSIEGRGVGSFYADDANTVKTEAYGALDFRLGWKGHWGRWRV